MFDVKIKSTTRGDVDFRDLLKECQDLGTSEVVVGIVDAGRTPYEGSKATLGEVALWQEFGTHDRRGNVMTPARSFIRTPTDNATEAIRAMMEQALVDLADKKTTVKKALGNVGRYLVRRMQDAIKRRINPPLAPYTLMKRREQGITGTIPLYATTSLYRAINSTVRRIGDTPKG